MPYTNKLIKDLHNKTYLNFNRHIKNPEERKEFLIKNRCEICCEYLKPYEKYYKRNKYNGLIVVCNSHQSNSHQSNSLYGK